MVYIIFRKHCLNGGYKKKIKIKIKEKVTKKILPKIIGDLAL